ncbi:signal recognition particle receptor subunit alpha, partial [Chloroflexota bacterium]
MVEDTNKWKFGLAKTSRIAFGRIAAALGATEVKESTWSDLEGSLIQADMGYNTAVEVSDAVKKAVYDEGVTKTETIKSILRVELRKRLEKPGFVEITQAPFVILLLGVNGSGKTTSAAKLGAYFVSEGKSVMFIAADTFRAAAVDQLDEWAIKLNIPIISGVPGSDPGAVVY